MTYTTSVPAVELDPDHVMRQLDDMRPPTQAGRDAARDAVRQRMAALGYPSIRAFVAARGVPYNNIAGFLRGDRDWPRNESRARIELSLGWEPGELARIAWEHAKEAEDATDQVAKPRRSHDLVVNSADEEVAMVLSYPARLFDGLDEADVLEIKAEAELASLRALRAIKAARATRSGSTSDGRDEATD